MRPAAGHFCRLPRRTRLAAGARLAWVAAPPGDLPEARVVLHEPRAEAAAASDGDDDYDARGGADPAHRGNCAFGDGSGSRHQELVRRPVWTRGSGEALHQQVRGRAEPANASGPSTLHPTTPMRCWSALAPQAGSPGPWKVGRGNVGGMWASARPCLGEKRQTNTAVSQDAPRRYAEPCIVAWAHKYKRMGHSRWTAGRVPCQATKALCAIVPSDGGAVLLSASRRTFSRGRRPPVVPSRGFHVASISSRVQRTGKPSLVWLPRQRASDGAPPLQSPSKHA